MAETYFPFDAGAGANVQESQWSLMARHWLKTGVIKNELNQLNPSANSSGLQVFVDTGMAWIRGHFYQNDAQIALPISTANATNPRIDLIVLHLDWTLNTINLKVLQGTPAATPTPPVVTQNTDIWEISIAQVFVAANASTIAPSNITDERGLVDPGGIMTTSDGTTTRSGFFAYASNNGTGVGLAANTWTKIPFNAVNFDNQSEFSVAATATAATATNSRYTAKNAETLIVSAGIELASVPSGAQIILSLYRNGAEWRRLDAKSAPAAGSMMVQGNLRIDLNPGDYIELWIESSLGTPIVYAYSTSAWFTGIQVA